jgi:hypothetical protein
VIEIENDIEENLDVKQHTSILSYNIRNVPPSTTIALKVFMSAGFPLGRIMRQSVSIPICPMTDSNSTGSLVIDAANHFCENSVRYALTACSSSDIFLLGSLKYTVETLRTIGRSGGKGEEIIINTSSSEQQQAKERQLAAGSFADLRAASWGIFPFLSFLA